MHAECRPHKGNNMFDDCNVNKILVKHLNACSYSVVDLGGLEGYSPPLLATLRNTKNSMY